MRVFGWQFREDMRIFGPQFKPGIKNMMIFGWQFKSGKDG